MSRVTLNVNGSRYSGWTTISITRSIERVAGSFDLSISEKWGGQNERWRIEPEDECTVSIDGAVLITGYVDRKTRGFAAEDHSLRLSGRDRTGMLVDCSAVLTGQWEFVNQPLLSVATLLAKPHGIAVTMQPGLKLPPPPARQTVNPGDTVFDVIERACRLSGVLPVSDGKGGLLLTRAGNQRTTTSLVEGQNILAADAPHDVTQCFRKYIVSGQFPGSNEYFGSALLVDATAQDMGVHRASRVMVVRPEGNTTVAYAQNRANWEASVRAARASTINVIVQGWQQADGSLWPVNALVPFKSPLLDIDTDLLITEATYALSDSAGTTTQLTLVRPDAFEPEPQVPPDPLWNIEDPEKRTANQ